MNVRGATDVSIVGAGGGTNNYLATSGGLHVWNISAVAKNSIDASGNLGAASAGVYGWTSSTVSTDARDTGLARNAAGVVEINDGTAGSFGDLAVRIVYVKNGTEPTCNSTNRGAKVFVEGGAGVADTYRICTKDAGDAYGWRSII